MGIMDVMILSAIITCLLSLVVLVPIAVLKTYRAYKERNSENGV